MTGNSVESAGLPRTLEDIKELAAEFSRVLKDIRATTALPNGSAWYPYESMANIWTLGDLLGDDFVDLLGELPGKRILDIGAADGDLSFFLERFAVHSTIIDNPTTNMNGLMGARALKQLLRSGVKIFEADLDQQFSLPDGSYDLVLFLGILYHLKNPYYVLERLALQAR